MARPVVLALGDPTDILRWHVTSTEVIVANDFVYEAGTGYIYAMSEAQSCSSLVGIALDSSASGETDDIAVAKRALVVCDCADASYYVGAGLTYSHSMGVKDDAGANTIAWCASNAASGASRLKILIDVLKLGGSDASNFETYV